MAVLDATKENNSYIKPRIGHSHVYTHTHTHINCKKEILPFATTRVDLEGIILSEISQMEKDKYCMISLIYGI